VSVQISGISNELCLEGLTNMIETFGISLTRARGWRMDEYLGFSCFNKL